MGASTGIAGSQVPDSSAFETAGGADAAEVAKFEALAAAWWDPDGPHAPLHAMNPCRLGYAVGEIAAAWGRPTRRSAASPRPLDGLCIADVGCGGGLMSEPLARLGAAVTGIDAAPASAPVARLHAEAQGLAIDYRTGTARDLVAGGRRFHAVVAMEVIEHAPDQPALVADCAALLEPGGVLVISTLNRTRRAWAVAILGAEYLLGWLPRGTHAWSRFVTPDEMAGMMAGAGLTAADEKGMVYDPLARTWRISERDLAVNYLALGLKPA
ncbi:MAG: bifunctional 2-polyprenyl-6-hydroxyphenol methylase/3-demethylubiquinol 3-O-methyltransferase UbiG [Pseudomonadota bacterium]